MIALIARLYRLALEYLKRYPAALAAVTNIVIALAARFGLHLTADQVVYLFTATTAILGALVHIGVVPLAKIVVKDVVAEVESPQVTQAVKGDAEKVIRQVVADVASAEAEK